MVRQLVALIPARLASPDYLTSPRLGLREIAAVRDHAVRQGFHDPSGTVAQALVDMNTSRLRKRCGRALRRAYDAHVFPFTALDE